MATYQFYLESCEIMDTRSFHEDTIVAGLGVIVNQQHHGKPIAAQVGEHNNGKFAFWRHGLGSLDKVEIGSDDQFVFIYQLYNNGQAGRPSVADVEAHIALDLLTAANDLLAMAKPAVEAKVQLAKLELEIKELSRQLQSDGPRVPGGAANVVAPVSAPAESFSPRTRVARSAPTKSDPAEAGNVAATTIGKPIAGAPMGGGGDHDALKKALKDMMEQQKQLQGNLGALANPHSFSVLMPGNDWRADGPFTSGDYSVKNYSSGKLISVLGNFILKGCDGPLALGFVAGSGRELEQRIPQVGPLRLSGDFRAKDLGFDVPCNHAGSHYVVNTVIQRH